MHKLKNLTISIILVMTLVLAGQFFDVSARPLADTTPDLGTVNSFAVFADSLISSAANASTINGDVGLEDGTGAAIGVQCQEVGAFTIYDRDNTYLGAGDSDVTCFTWDPILMGTADTDLITAYDRLAATDNATCDSNVAGVQNLSLLSPLGPGIYCATSFSIPTNLSLSGSGIWIFRSASLIDTGTGVTVSGPGANSCNVWWRAETSVTIGTGNDIVGNFLALDSISDDGGSTINGRLLARNGAVTLDTTTVNRGPLCVSTTGGGGGGGGESIDSLPNTGAAPIRNEDIPNMVVIGGLGVIALALGLRAYRRSHLAKR